MKKLSLILVCAILSTGIAIAQKSAVSQAEKDLTKLEPNFESARKTIKGALTNPETKDDVKTWYVAGWANFAAYDDMLGKNQIKKDAFSKLDMANAIYDAYVYSMKALPMDSIIEINKKTGEPKLDKKGNKKYKTKYSKNILSRVNGHLNDYSVAGQDFYEAKDYNKAQYMWDAFVKTAIKTKNQKDAVQVPDSIIGQLSFYVGVARYMGENYDQATSAFELAREYDYDTKETYDYALACYSNLQNNEKIIETAKLAFPKFGNEDSQYVSILINDYINNEKYEDAKKLLDEAIAANPQKAEFYDVKGTICEQLNDMDNAIANFQKAVEVDPTYAKGQFNVGRYYYNIAVKNNEKSPTGNREYKEYFEKNIKPYYEQALPYMEKAYQLDSSNGDIKRALENLYYLLGDEAKLNAIEGK